MVRVQVVEKLSGGALPGEGERMAAHDIAAQIKRGEHGSAQVIAEHARLTRDDDIDRAR